MSDAPPPSYTEATGRATFTHRPGESTLSPNVGNRDPSELRHSMEDEERPLPAGWVRQYNTEHAHVFFVDIEADPPRSIWHHPYDDETYLKSLPTEERERIQEAARKAEEQDPLGEHTDEELDNSPAAGTAAGPSSSKGDAPPSYVGGSSSADAKHQTPSELPPRPAGKGASSLRRRMKDKLTGTTHEQRVQERQQREERERQQHAQYLAYRRALQRAAETGQRQLLGHDAQGKEVWVEPPMHDPYGGGYGGYAAPYGSPYARGPYYGGMGMMGGPRQAMGMYPGRDPRYIRPGYPYGRSGFGGGGMALPLVGGIAGGALLGSLLF
ncbi:hypothetical protein FH972_022828 [Carpinus fangiana]|uniref:WW domain-containing protein n=1 Tax=Carpinus fangiana TaxID=176857 RepID=A0A5N6KTD4_9ROSI|nr:hypothetical protein FH972_022828 [Carpinus fangiana]